MCPNTRWPLAPEGTAGPQLVGCSLGIPACTFSGAPTCFPRGPACQQSRMRHHGPMGSAVLWLPFTLGELLPCASGPQGREGRICPEGSVGGFPASSPSWAAYSTGCHLHTVLLPPCLMVKRRALQSTLKTQPVLHAHTEKRGPRLQRVEFVPGFP